MSKYKISAIRNLKKRQIRDASPEARRRQMERAEQLVHELDPEERYSYRELCKRITGEPPRQRKQVNVTGRDALHDLRLFVEDLSDSTDISVETAGEPVLTLEEVSERFNVSTKTVDRWRDRGLVSRRFRFGNRKRIGFLQSSVERFVANHTDEVRRGSHFRQLTAEERADIVSRARRLAGQGETAAEITDRLAQEFHRSAEAIRYTIKHHDEEHPGMAVFPQPSTALTDEQKNAIYQGYRRGIPVERLAERYHRTKPTVHRIVNEVRARRLLEQKIEYVDNDEFDDPRAEEVILGPPPEEPRRKTGVRPPAGLPPYLASLYEIPLLSREQEVYYFRKMNYLKYRAATLREKLDPKRPRARDLDTIEGLLKQADDVKNLLIRRNLRLVVSIAKKYMRPGANLFEMVSDGNVSLIRAIEKFDYSRGFKLSTYATWAIRRNFARSIPAEFTHMDRYRTGHDELFQASPDDGANQFEQERNQKRQHEALMKILNQLRDRERDILLTRYGLEEGAEPQTLEEVGSRFGVTKERIRQLEKRALGKLRDIAAQEKLDIPGL